MNLKSRLGAALKTESGLILSPADVQALASQFRIGVERDRPARESTGERMPVHVRWMVSLDMSDVQRIENAAFSYPWTSEDFKRCLSQRHVIGNVAESERFGVVGYMIFELQSAHYQIVALAVDPDHWGQQIGSQLVARLKTKLGKRRKISLLVSETNTDAQLFWQYHGFVATEIIKQAYKETTADGIFMEYELPAGVRG